MTKQPPTPFHALKPSAQRHADRIARDAKKTLRRERDGKFIYHTKGERR